MKILRNVKYFLKKYLTKLDQQNVMLIKINDSYIIESSFVGLEGNYFVQSALFIAERNIYNLCYFDNLFNAKHRNYFERKTFSSRKIYEDNSL